MNWHDWNASNSDKYFTQPVAHTHALSHMVPFMCHYIINKEMYNTEREI